MAGLDIREDFRRPLRVAMFGRALRTEAVLPCTLLDSGTPIRKNSRVLLYVLQELSPPLKAYNGGGGSLVRVVSNVGDGESEVHVRSGFSFSAKGEGGAQRTMPDPASHN